MSTKLISALIILLIAFGGYRLYVYYQQVEQARWGGEEVNAGENFDPSRLEGVPASLEEPLRRAQTQGAEALGTWRESYDNQIRDPRKAWIQLDYCTLLARDDPHKAREVYQEVRQRVNESSPVHSWVMQMQKTFE